jgi:GMP synthase-like glutamine amidotransferase
MTDAAARIVPSVERNLCRWLPLAFNGQEVVMSKSMHEGVETWCDTCSCEPEPRWQAVAEELDDEAETAGAERRDGLGGASGGIARSPRTLRVHYLQHVPFEGPGAIAEWVRGSGHALSGTHAYRGDRPPGVEGFDVLVVMGGPMSVNDADQYGWIEPEIRLIREAVEAGKPVLGVCLGAQLLAAAFGAAVRPTGEKEIGWFPVRRVSVGPGGDDALAGFPETFTPLHWHGETFELPDGAERLAETEACSNQAFQLGRRAVGLQFHLEATPESVRPLVEQCGEEIGAGRFEQLPDWILDCEQRSAAVRPLLYRLLDRLTQV